MIKISQIEAFYIREKVSPDQIKMTSVRKKSRGASNGHTYYMVESRESLKALTEFRKNELNKK